MQNTHQEQLPWAAAPLTSGQPTGRGQRHQRSGPCQHGKPVGAELCSRGVEGGLSEAELQDVFCWAFIVVLCWSGCGLLVSFLRYRCFCFVEGKFFDMFFEPNPPGLELLAHHLRRETGRAFDESEDTTLGQSLQTLHV